MSNQNEDLIMTDSDQRKSDWKTRISESKSLGWLAFVALVIVVVIGAFLFG
jgi:hypothetical protein